VLSDEGKRASYDRTGSIDAAEGLAGESFDELYAYFRDRFKEVTPADLDDYELRFRGSPDERRELFELHARFRGKMEKVFEWLVCSDPARDSHRFAAAVREGVASGELEGFPAFERWCKAKIDGRPPPAEDPLKPRPRAAEMMAGRKGKGGGGGGGASSLALQIRANNGEDRLAGIIASIEARAAGGKKKAGGAASKKTAAAAAPKASNKKHKAPPTDEEFEAAAARLEPPSSRTTTLTSTTSLGNAAVSTRGPSAEASEAAAALSATVCAGLVLPPPSPKFALPPEKGAERRSTATRPSGEKAEDDEADSSELLSASRGPKAAAMTLVFLCAAPPPSSTNAEPSAVEWTPTWMTEEEGG